MSDSTISIILVFLLLRFSLEDATYLRQDYNLTHLGVSEFDAQLVRRRLVGNGKPLLDLLAVCTTTTL
jgi:hypothetical protein